MSICGSVTNDWRLLLCNKVVFITGGAGWIARHIAKTCYEHGSRLVLADTKLETILRVKNEIFPSENTDERILSIELDVLNEESIQTAVKSTLNKWNTIDILINTFVNSDNLCEISFSRIFFSLEQQYSRSVLLKIFHRMTGQIYSTLMCVVML